MWALYDDQSSEYYADRSKHGRIEGLFGENDPASDDEVPNNSMCSPMEEHEIGDNVERRWPDAFGEITSLVLW